MKGGSPHTISFRRIHHTTPFLDTNDLKMALQARNLSRAFEKRAPGRTYGPGTGLSAAGLLVASCQKQAGGGGVGRGQSPSQEFVRRLLGGGTVFESMQACLFFSVI